MAVTALNSNQQSAWDLMTQTLASWGITTLGADLRNLILQGSTSPDTLTMGLRNTDAYKTRFAGNAERTAKGLPELSPAQYIAAEEGYQNTLAQHGLPQGFYDSKKDFDQFIANDVSPAELDTRAKIASEQYQLAPAEWKQQWKDYYGLSDGAAIAAILDPKTSLDVLQNEAQQVGIGAAAKENGLTLDHARAAGLAAQGVTADQAKKAYADIGQHVQGQADILSRFGQGQQAPQAQSLMEDAQLAGKAGAASLLNTVNSNEQGLFKGGVSADQNSLAVAADY